MELVKMGTVSYIIPAYIKEIAGRHVLPNTTLNEDFIFYEKHEVEFNAKISEISIRLVPE